MLSGHSFLLRFCSANLAVSAKRSCSANGKTAKYLAYGLKNLTRVPLVVLFSERLDVWKTSIDGPLSFSLLSAELGNWFDPSLSPSKVGKSSRNSPHPVKSCGQYKWLLMSWFLLNIVDRLIDWSSRTIWNEKYDKKDNNKMFLLKRFRISEFIHDE